MKIIRPRRVKLMNDYANKNGIITIKSVVKIIKILNILTM